MTACNPTESSLQKTDGENVGCSTIFSNNGTLVNFPDEFFTALLGLKDASEK